MSQKIIIPKGLINPNETTIIEIPEEIQDIETVVAKPVYMNDHYHSEDMFENEFLEENSKFEYIDDFYDADYEHSESEKGRVGIRTTQSYPIYKYHQKNNVYADESYYTYSNTVFKPFMHNWEEDEIIPLTSNAKIDSKTDRNLTVKQVVSILDILEKVELKRLYKNLKNYQSARRKLLFETANIHTFDDICSSLYGLY